MSVALPIRVQGRNALELDNNIKVVLDRDSRWGPQPTTIRETLQQATDLLKQEGTWCTDSLFQDGDAQEAFENGSICGSWQVCAMGALGIVSGEMPIKVGVEFDSEFMDQADYYWFEDQDRVYNRSIAPLSNGAADYVAHAIALEGYELDVEEWDKDVEQLGRDGVYWQRPEEPTRNFDPDFGTYSTVYNFNDQSDRESVVRVFERALALAIEDGV